MIVLVLGFRSSASLASAYGVAVTGTFVLNTILFLVVARTLWHRPTLAGRALGASIFLTTEVTFFAANLTKIAHGGWLPLLVAAVVFTVLMTWQRGRVIVTRNRAEEEGPLLEFLEPTCTRCNRRSSGCRARPCSSTRRSTPRRWRCARTSSTTTCCSERVDHPEHRGRRTSRTSRTNDRLTGRSTSATTDDGHHPSAGPLRLPGRAERARPRWPARSSSGLLERRRPATRSPTSCRGSPWCGPPSRRCPRWQKRLFLTIAHNSANPVEYFGLPIEHSISMGAQIEV